MKRIPSFGRQGAEARKLWLVDKRQVSIQHELPDGKRIPVAIVSSGGAFGWSELVWPHQLTATSIALSETRLRAIERDALLKLMHEDTKMGLLIMQDVAEVIASRLRNLEAERIVALPPR